MMLRTEIFVPPYAASMQHIASYREIDEVLRSPKFRQGSHQHTKMFMGGSIVLLDGPEHFARRRLISSLFSKASLQHYESDGLAPVIDNVMRELKQRRGPDGLVRADLVVLVRTFLHRISAMVTGVDDVTSNDRIERFRIHIERVSEGLTAEWTTQDREAVIERGMAFRSRLIDEFIRPSWERRRDLVGKYRDGKIEKTELPTDLLTLLELHRDDSWTEENIWREATFFAVASTLTTTHNFPHLIWHLAEWFADHPEDSERATDVEFLRHAAYESLRLHQPAPTLLRIALEDLSLSSGRRILKEECVALLFTPANRDKDVFGVDADEFNPYRDVPSGLRPWGLTFGSGPHLCPGRPLVTGQSNYGGDDNSSTLGTIVSMTRALQAAGVELDPLKPATRTSGSYYDAFDNMGVVFRKL